MLYVCPWHEVDVHVEDLEATHVVSLLGVEGEPMRPAGIADDRHLHLELDDIAGPIGGYITPDADHVDELLDFARAWDRAGPMIVHCYAGISRSTAAALAIVCLYNPGQEEAAARQLRERTPFAQPNRRILAIADDRLALEGRLVRAVEGLGPRRREATMGRLVELSVRLP